VRTKNDRIPNRPLEAVSEYFSLSLRERAGVRGLRHDRPHT
jgi:hypothetical protein